MLPTRHGQCCIAIDIHIVPCLHCDYITFVDPNVVPKCFLIHAIGVLHNKPLLIARRVTCISTMDGIAGAVRLAVYCQCGIDGAEMLVSVAPQHLTRANAVAETSLGT